MSIQLMQRVMVQRPVRLVLAALLAVGAPASGSGAQQGGGMFSRLAGVSGSNTGARPADVAAMKRAVAQVDSVFRRDAAIAPPPADVMIQPFGSVRARVALTGQILPASYSIFLLRPKQSCSTPGCRIDAGEGPELRVRLNDPLAVMGIWGGAIQPIDRTGSLATMYKGKRQIGELSGFPLYENGALVIAKPGQPVWLPVTRAEYARAQLESMRAMHLSGGDLEARAEQELASLEDPGGAAWCCRESHAHPIGVTDARTEGADPIVRLNPAYFDMHASPSAVQLLVVGTERVYAAERGAKPTEPNFVLLKAIREQLDWAALAAMLH